MQTDVCNGKELGTLMNKYMERDILPGRVLLIGNGTKAGPLRQTDDRGSRHGR